MPKANHGQSKNMTGFTWLLGASVGAFVLVATVVPTMSQELAGFLFNARVWEWSNGDYNPRLAKSDDPRHDPERRRWPVSDEPSNVIFFDPGNKTYWAYDDGGILVRSPNLFNLRAELHERSLDPHGESGGG